MKKILFLALTVSTVSAYGQTALSQFDVSLGDGQEYVMSYYPLDNPCEEQEAGLVETYIGKTMESPLLRAIGIGAFEEDVRGTIGENVRGVYIKKGFYNAFVGSYGFQEFCHKLLRSPKVRDVLFDLLSGIVCDLCRIYPKDFKDSLIEAIIEMKGTVEELGTHQYEARHLEDWGENPVLFIDGRMAHDDSFGFEGVLIRRVLLDDLTFAEMSDYLDRLLDKVGSVDVRENPDVMERVRVNDELSYLVTTNGNYYVAERSGVKLFPYEPGSYEQFYEMSKVQCIKDRTSNMYKITNGTLVSSPEEHWQDATDPHLEGVMIIDDRGEILFRE